MFQVKQSKPSEAEFHLSLHGLVNLLGNQDTPWPGDGPNPVGSVQGISYDLFPDMPYRSFVDAYPDRDIMRITASFLDVYGCLDGMGTGSEQAE
jgi:hypothetical protein